MNLGRLLGNATRALALAAALLSSPGEVSGRNAAPLRVCADPNNLPFSNAKKQGFENRIAEIVARDLDVELEYVWWAQRRGFFRNTIKAGRCDLVIGVPQALDALDTTRPYYRSTYVFVQRRRSAHVVRSLDDPALRRLKVAVQLIGDDAANTPPAHALARRGIVDNVVGFMVYGDYASDDPQAPIVEAVDDGEVDVAIVWGPLAGYYAKRASQKLRLTAVSPQLDQELPLTFAIAAGVRKGDVALKKRVEGALGRRKREIDAVLASFGVPLSQARR
jgi:mxaJ protein